MRKRLWTAATILSALALLGTVAGAANSGADMTSLDLDGVVASITSSAASTVATETSQQAPTTQADKNNEKTVNDAVEAETNDDDNPVISASTEAAPSGTTSTKPGWGCGDKNHEHSGPPGRPGATPPPGCDKAGGNGQSGTNGNNASNGTGQQGANPSHSNNGKGKGKP